MQALFKNSKGDVAEAVLVGDVWQIVTREKKPVRVHRRKTVGKGGEEIGKTIGKTIKEVVTVLAELSNDEFKAQFTPTNHAAIDLMESTPEPKELPKQKKTSKSSTQKSSTSK